MIIGQGAEATIERAGEKVRKTRTSKKYRHPQLDTRLRQFRTRREATVLEKLSGSAPKLLASDDVSMTIDMEFVDAKQLRDVLTEENASEYMRKLASLLRSLHDQGIVHGDLTSSNILVREGELILIDFGLSEFSDHVKDYAVDLHLLKHSLMAKHPSLDLWSAFWSAYGASQPLSDRFEQVEARGRYKGKNA